MNPNTESNYKNNGLEKTLITEEIISQARAAFMAAREIRDHQTLFVGIGLPCLVAHFSHSILSPSCHLVFESGLMEVSCETQPLSTASANIAKTAKMRLLAIFAIFPQTSYFDKIITKCRMVTSDPAFESLWSILFNPLNHLSDLLN